MSLIRIRALERLGELIAARVPELAGSICMGQASPSHRLGFPSLSITAVRFQFFPDQAGEHVAPANSTRAVFNVGRVQATVQLRLGAASARERYRLEQALLETVFWQDLDRPGVLLLDIPDCDDARIAYEQDSEEWQDEKAFDREWYSVMALDLQLPALVTQPVYTIDQLVLQLEEQLADPDFTTEVIIDETGLLPPDTGAVLPSAVTYGYGSAPYGVTGYGVGV